MGLPKEIAELIERFDRNLETYKSGQYNEAQLRQDFLNPFFGALGWDMTNKAGYAEAYREVIHEDAIKIGGATKAPDYCFRIGSAKKFFVEAKKPSVNLKDDVSPAFQLRRYAWSAKLPLSILTDFEEFAVYDCRIKPVQTDKASTGRVLYFTYKDFPAKWDELVNIFSREAVLKGSFDKYAESSKLKKGTATVDDAFLTEIEDWRDMLAKNIALRNADLSTRELNFAVQRTIDRIVFLRICEDRGIEEYGRLQTQLNGTNVYKRLVQLFSQADDRYNSGLFHFQREKERHEEPDKLTPNVSIDDKPLKDIINRLYYPESPYEFSVLSADILGQVYEQFLGKVIRLTAGHQAKVEEKPEVRKAGGVYYTPKYIVDYIVKNTVGTLLSPILENATSLPPFRKGGSGGFEASDVNPPQSPFAKGGNNITPKEASKLRILDPACGSGSFLLGAYQYLLDWHLKWYIDNEPDKWAKAKQPSIYQGPSPDPHTPNWNLTTSEKKRILLNNIYGVDIDSQAVEVTKLSLLLKVLEGENNQTLANQLRMFHERALPDLGDNIKCGNSLIGPDFYQQRTMLDDDERYRVNVFDWEKEFPQIMNAGGFDAVIGNPPWGADFTVQEQEYLRKFYQVAQGSNIDSYAVFIESSLNRLRNRGLLGYITPDTFLRKDDHLLTRKLLLEKTWVQELIETGPVFSKVRDTWCLVSILAKGKPAADSIVRHRKLSRFIVSVEERLNKFGRGEWDEESEVMQSVWLKRPKMIVGYLASEPGQCLIAKLEKCQPLGQVSTRYRISRGEEGSKNALNKQANGKFFMVIPQDVERYAVQEGMRISSDTLTPNKIESLYKHPKIWIIRIQKMRWKQRVVCGLDERSNSAGMKTLQVVVSPSDNLADLKYLSAILASSLINFWCINYLADDMNQSYLEKIPVRLASLNEPIDKACYDKMVSLVDQMLSLNKQLLGVQTDHEKIALQRQIDATDRQIDQLVYELYGLTEKEIMLIEGKN